MAISSLMKEALAGPLRDHGFSKKSNSWYLTNEEVILVVNLQKSEFGQQYYVNCAVALKELVATPYPKEYHGDIRFRLASVVPESRREECNLAFDLEKGSLSEDQRKDLASLLFEQYGLSLLLECRSLAGIASAYRSGRLPEWTISKKVIDLLQQRS